MLDAVNASKTRSKTTANVVMFLVLATHNTRKGVSAVADITPEQLRDMRQAAGYTLERLAHEASCSFNTVRLFESGYAPRKSPTRDRIIAVLSRNCGALAGQGERAGTATNASHSAVPNLDHGTEVDNARQ